MRPNLIIAALGLALAATPAAAQGSGDAQSGWRATIAARLMGSLDRKALPTGTTVVVRFSVSRRGAVSGISTSGTDDPRTLAAVRRMLRRAAPLPPFPADAAGDHIVVTLPISFR